MFCKNKYIISTTQTKEKKNLNMFSTFCKPQSQPASAKLQNVFKELALWIRKV